MKNIIVFLVFTLLFGSIAAGNPELGVGLSWNAPAADLKEDEPPGEGDGSGAKSPAKVIPLHKQRP